MARRGPLGATLVDWLPVLLLPPVLIADAAVSPAGRPITPVAVACAFAGCLPLVLRRRLPFPLLIPPMVGGILLELAQLHPADTVVLIPMIALFHWASSGTRTMSLLLAAGTVPCVVVSVLPFAAAGQVIPIVLGNVAMCELAIAAGEMRRSSAQASRRALEAREQEMLRAASEDRLRIARELHDGIAHAMTAINVQAGVAAHLLDREPGQAHDALRHIKRTSGEALNDLRATLELLRDPQARAPTAPVDSLDGLSALTAGLNSTGVEVSVAVDPVEDLPDAVRGAGYRIVQEALTNVARHADARRVSVQVRRSPQAVEIEVLDDGAGAPPAPGGNGNGLRGMRERAAALGGTLTAGPGAGGGWRVQAVLPLQREGRS